MNLLKHYIKKVHSVEDVTGEYESVVGRKLEQHALKVDMTIDCYGIVERTTQYFLKSDWEDAKDKGFYVA